MDPKPDSQGAALGVWEPRMQVVHRSEDTKPSADRSLGIVLMRLRIAKIDQQTIAQELGDVPVIPANHLRTGGVIRSDYAPILFGDELAGELRGVHEVTEHHRELPTFSIRRRRGDWGGLTLCRRDVRRGWQRHWRGGWRCAG